MKTVSVLKIKQLSVPYGIVYETAYAVIISEKDKPNNTYCIYRDEEIARMDAVRLQLKFAQGIFEP